MYVCMYISSIYHSYKSISHKYCLNISNEMWVIYFRDLAFPFRVSCFLPSEGQGFLSICGSVLDVLNTTLRLEGNTACIEVGEEICGLINYVFEARPSVCTFVNE